jgi:hypothetical protein
MAVMLVVIPTVSSAQFRGLGRITGHRQRRRGQADEQRHHPRDPDGRRRRHRRKSDQKGTWAVAGVAKGEWHLTFQIAGYVPVGARVVLPAELTRVAPISITLKKVSKG